MRKEIRSEWVHTCSRDYVCVYMYICMSYWNMKRARTRVSDLRFGSCIKSNKKFVSVIRCNFTLWRFGTDHIKFFGTFSSFGTVGSSEWVMFVIDLVKRRPSTGMYSKSSSKSSNDNKGVWRRTWVSCAMVDSSIVREWRFVRTPLSSGVNEVIPQSINVICSKNEQYLYSFRISTKKWTKKTIHKWYWVLFVHSMQNKSMNPIKAMIEWLNTGTNIPRFCLSCMER